ncbi:MAG TPA: MlaD family protein [Solirubrobacterales bacterium]|nr:MlaD family protein [Solirubrobacterales bacterium]
MQKQAPSIGRILIAAGFTLSCFAITLFLWIAFGGPIPLKPESYRVTAYFPEATQLAAESDVRVGGVSVGKVKELALAPPDKRVNGKDTTEAVIEIEPKFAPISSDAEAILRSKTLLGETYVELTSGSPDGEDVAPVALGAATAVSDAEAESIEAIPEGGTLGIGQVTEQTQIDEIFNALDADTRRSFRRWQANAATAIQGRGLDLNDGMGNFGPFVTDLTEVVEILDRQSEALQGMVRDTGTVFDALTARGNELATLIESSNEAFDALASEERALAETFRILPTFQRESRATFERLDTFQADARPLMRELIPIARELSPTLRSVRELAPHLRAFFPRLDQLQRASERGLPAMRETLEGLAPLFDELDPFLASLNPVIRYLELQKETVADFLVVPGAGLSGAMEARPGDPAPRHYLRQLSYLSSEALAIHPSRLPTNRGNTYKAPGALNSPLAAERGIFGQFDCKNTNFTPGASAQGWPDSPRPETEDEIEIWGSRTRSGVNAGQPASGYFAPCWVEGGIWSDGPFGGFGDGRAPQIFDDP